MIGESRIGAALSATIFAGWPSFAGGQREHRRGGHCQTIRNLAGMNLRGPLRGVVALACAVLLAVSGCARFDHAQSQPFPPEPELAPGPPSTPPPPPPLPPKPFPKECPAPGVMQ